ncbi:uncharacterized protein NEPG_01545 [Nematocida parisii ERTm1]|uniref:uncharacterized protein n=1 Tax=Nematocida parisii (strain ERTm1 / ATCC PRA-289) TaxID=881290 RepID=UPI000264B3BD|nr:uncharacterized protein NEPG_01545 [Nematocida parisii ERTm1]EIJ93973.1 hypothetical protein NEPG_01545 [Nematocida parisii ERTm1]|eukprot:XP_013059373.1 hypothetical protein NEPG_01545 [Nematocida parisii ERTm1]
MPKDGLYIIDKIKKLYSSEDTFQDKYAPIAQMINSQIIRSIEREFGGLYVNKTYDILIKSIFDDIIKNIKIRASIVWNTINHVTEDDRQRTGWHTIMNNNHLNVVHNYLPWKDFLYNTLDEFSTKQSIKKPTEAIYSADVIKRLFELTESKECSRLQRVLDILEQHGKEIVTINESGNEESNMKKLGLEPDDIYSLQLFTRANPYEIDQVIADMYGMISIQDQDDVEHNVLKDIITLSLFNDTTTGHINKKIKTFIKNLKESMNTFKTAKTIIISKESSQTISDICSRYECDPMEFKNNVAKKYLESLKDKLSSVNDSSAVLDLSNLENVQSSNMLRAKKASMIILAILSIIMIIAISYGFINLDKTKALLRISTKSS